MKKEKELFIIVSVLLTIIGILIIILWAIGKSFGWIHSPVWVNMIPFFWWCNCTWRNWHRYW